jgi:uncharacterized membrane protein HdeD (DUF308 family)
MTTITKLTAGAVGFAVGVWLLADLPVNFIWPQLVTGWVLLLVGVAVMAPSLLDLIDPDGDQ